MTAVDMIREGFGIWMHSALGGDMFSTPIVFTLLFLFGFMAAALVKNASLMRSVATPALSHENQTILDAANTARLVELESEVLAQKELLKRFTETLSTTYAHLSAGLAIFDADKSLHVFNPALCDLLGLDPVWLAGRPCITDFLGKMREHRNIPDTKDFLKWRRQFTEFQTTRSQDSFETQWVLPDGRVIRVTTQPHPLGAVALVFEDISSQIIREREHRRASGVSRRILHSVSDAVAVIDAVGKVTFSNPSFDKRLGISISDAPSIFSVKDCGAVSPESSGFWSKLSLYSSAPEGVEVWEQELRLSDGEQLTARVSPLPDGSTLLCLSDTSQKQESLPLDLVDTFRLPALESLLKNRNVTLDRSKFGFESLESVTSDWTRRALWLLVISTANTCRDGGVVYLSSVTERSEPTINCTVGEGDRLKNPGENLAGDLLLRLTENSDVGDWSFHAKANRQSLTGASTALQRSGIG